MNSNQFLSLALLISALNIITTFAAAGFAAGLHAKLDRILVRLGEHEQ